MMIIQSFQPQSVLDDINKNGLAFSKPDFSIWDGEIINPDLIWGFRHSYEWMVQQMNRSVENNTFAKFPFWGWAWSGDNDQKYIDLSLHKEYSGEYLITMELDEKDLFFSDFQLWHYVLNYWPIVSSEEERIFFEALEKDKKNNYYDNKPLKDIVYDLKIRNTWNKIFSLRKSGDFFISSLSEKEIEYLEMSPEEKIVTQSCFWNIEKKNILKVEKI